MIRINLLPVREVEKASSRRKEMILAGGLIAITCGIVLFVHFLQGVQLNSTDAELSRLEGAITKIRTQNQELEKMERQKKDIEEKIRVVRLLTSPERRAASVHVMDDLSASTPESLWLTDFVEGKGAAKISGKAIDNQTIAAFAHSLSNSRYFRNVEIRETIQEAPLVDPRRRAGAAKTSAPDAALPVPVTKFLIEAYINYVPNIPSRQKEDAQESPGKRGGRKVEEGKPIKAKSERGER
jgi:type IV pilus assembly protein PilN